MPLRVGRNDRGETNRYGLLPSIDSTLAPSAKSVRHSKATSAIIPTCFLPNLRYPPELVFQT